MKNTESVTLKARRDRHFLECCRRILRDAKEPLTAPQVAVMAAASPAPEFYIGYDWALRNIRHYRKGGYCGKEGGSSRRMFADIIERVDRLMSRGSMSERRALARVLAEGQAPCFYLTPGSAIVLYCNLLAKARSERACSFGSRLPAEDPSTPRRRRHISPKSNL